MTAYEVPPLVPDAMASTLPSIKLLPVEAQLQLQSSVALNSIEDAVIGLVKNSLDAQAQIIRVEIDFARGYCSVEDDGVGIPAAEFGAKGGLGLMHNTSKFATTNETHGRHGRFLASLAATSLLSVSSCYGPEQQESNILFQRSRVISRNSSVSEKKRGVGRKGGTVVVIRDLFGNLPVRLKQRAIHFTTLDNVEKELDRLKRHITAIILAWRKPVRVSVSVHENQQKGKFALGTFVKPGGSSSKGVYGPDMSPGFRLDRVYTLLSHAGYITPADFPLWTSISARTIRLFVRAAISLEPAPTKQVQFISLGVHPLDQSSNLSQVLYGEVNTLFTESGFGIDEHEHDISEQEQRRRLKDRRFKSDGYTKRRVRRTGKGPDRWPMFYIRIDRGDRASFSDDLGSDENDGHAAHFLEKCVQLTRSMIYQFLQERNFRPRNRRSRSTLHRGRIRSITKEAASDPPTGETNQTPIREGDLVNSPALRQSGLAPDPRKPFSAGERKRPTLSDPAGPFRLWSRVKSGNLRAFEDLLSGLPQSKLPEILQQGNTEAIRHIEDDSFHIRNPTEENSAAEGQLGNDVQLPVREFSKHPDFERPDGQSGCEQGAQNLPPSKLPEHSHGRESSVAAPEDSAIVWKNPTSGKAVRINSRTGLCIADSIPSTNSVPQSLTSDLTARFPVRSTVSVRIGGAKADQFDPCAEVRSEPSTWLGSLLSGWENPVFHTKERAVRIPVAEVIHSDKACVRLQNGCHGAYEPCAQSKLVEDVRLSKVALGEAAIIGQVDQKFILAVMESLGSERGHQSSPKSKEHALILIDQHAADERCRVENLYAEICNAMPTLLPKPITFEITLQESELFRREQTLFRAWGVVYDVGTAQQKTVDNAQTKRPALSCLPSVEVSTDVTTSRRPAPADIPWLRTTVPDLQEVKDGEARVVVQALPEQIAERCRLEPKMLINMLRSEVWGRVDSDRHLSTAGRSSLDDSISDQEKSPYPWLERLGQCPRGIIELLNSRACRSAVMFNDHLGQMDCETLVTRLAKCAFPFQCAHGRPSLAVLGGLDSEVLHSPRNLGPNDQASRPSRGNELDVCTQDQSYLRAFMAWQERSGECPVHPELQEDVIVC